MNHSRFRAMRVSLAIAVASLGAATSYAVTSMSYVGSDYDIGGTFFPGGSEPFVVVPWRSNGATKAYDIDGSNVYGSDGYALFATEFEWPSPFQCCGGSVGFSDNSTYANLIDLPSYLSSSTNLQSNKVGGWTYALVDDPREIDDANPRNFSWGDSLTPAPTNPGTQSAYVKIGILDGTDSFGNNPSSTPAGRWSFTIGDDAPPIIRVGVMSDGLDDAKWAANEIILANVSSGVSIISSVTTSTVARNRFVDIHTFDIVGAQAGDVFSILSTAATGGNGAISGVTFDSAIPEPTTLGLSLLGAAVLAAVRRRA